MSSHIIIIINNHNEDYPISHDDDIDCMYSV